MQKKQQKTALEIEAILEKGGNIGKFLPQKIEPGFHRSKFSEKSVLRTTVDFGAEISKDLELVANINNISKAAVIKMAVLDYLMRFNQYRHDRP